MISIIIPAFNEEATIKYVVEETIRVMKEVGLDFEVIVVDDGSSDKTRDLAGGAGAEVIHHPYNKGNGASVKRGARAARGDVFLFLDADGQHNPQDIPKLLENLEGYDMVVGAREGKFFGSLIRRLGNRIFILLANYLSSSKIPDLISGFRVVKRDVFLRFLHLLPNGYSYPATITLTLIKEGYSVKYVPLETISERKGGKS
ncbi:MAG: glycosyl transferase, partial [Armatimonadetes bacterium CG07_land_8_20_14_0_80_40_9]